MKAYSVSTVVKAAYFWNKMDWRHICLGSALMCATKNDWIKIGDLRSLANESRQILERFGLQSASPYCALASRQCGARRVSKAVRSAVPF